MKSDEEITKELLFHIENVIQKLEKAELFRISTKSMAAEEAEKYKELHKYCFDVANATYEKISGKPYESNVFKK